MVIDATRQRTRLMRCLVAVALVAFVHEARAAQVTAQRTFAAPDDAAAALVDAIKRDDVNGLRAIFGPDADALLDSGDPVEDAAARKRFADAAAAQMRIERHGDTRAEVVVGADDWPFPVPIVKHGDAWRFDTAAGEDELVNRRIGRNELRAIETCRAFVDAQRDYAIADRDGKGAGAYAMKVLSSPGAHDGLYWTTPEGEPTSPLGPFVAAASQEGYRGRRSETPEPFHGYYFRVLKAQGPSAPGGAKSYVQAGRMTGGFALVAYPATPGVSGIMTFIVNHNGIVFQKNLGRKTADIAGRMTRYDPDRSWTPVAD